MIILVVRGSSVSNKTPFNNKRGQRKAARLVQAERMTTGTKDNKEIRVQWSISGI